MCLSTPLMLSTAIVLCLGIDSSRHISARRFRVSSHDYPALGAQDRGILFTKLPEIPNMQCHCRHKLTNNEFAMHKYITLIFLHLRAWTLAVINKPVKTGTSPPNGRVTAFPSDITIYVFPTDQNYM